MKTFTTHYRDHGKNFTKDFFESIDKIKEAGDLKRIRQVIFLREGLEDWFLNTICKISEVTGMSNKIINKSSLAGIPIKIVDQDIIPMLKGAFESFEEVILINDKGNMFILTKDILELNMFKLGKI